MTFPTSPPPSVLLVERGDTSAQLDVTFDQPVNLVGFPGTWHDGTPTSPDAASVLAADKVRLSFPGFLYTCLSPLTVIAGDLAITSVATGQPVAPGVFAF